MGIVIYLALCGHRSMIISGGGQLITWLERDGCKQLHRPCISEKNTSCLNYIKKFKRLYIRERIDIIHLRSRLPGWIGYLACNMFLDDDRPALVTSFHGLRLVNQYSTIMTRGKKIIAVSKTIRDHVLRNYHVEPNRNKLIHGRLEFQCFNSDLVCLQWLTPCGANCEWMAIVLQ